MIRWFVWEKNIVGLRFWSVYFCILCECILKVGGLSFFLFFPNIFVILFTFPFLLFVWLGGRVLLVGKQILLVVIYICPTIFMIWKKGGFGMPILFKRVLYIIYPLHNWYYYCQRRLDFWSSILGFMLCMRLEIMFLLVLLLIWDVVKDEMSVFSIMSFFSFLAAEQRKKWCYRLYFFGIVIFG